jgi:cysteinyl-tRNA synthetase
MSKSLKNFITIEEALTRATARQLRLAFLLQQWNSRMDFNEKDMSEVKAIETRFNNFFTNVNALVSDYESRAQESSGSHLYRQAEKELTASLEEAQEAFHAALCDSFNTTQAMSALISLVTSANVYVTSRSRAETNIDTLRAVSDWVTRMLRTFGLGEGPDADSQGKRIIGWGQARSTGANGEESGDREAVLMPYLRALSTFRDSVRRLAREEGKASEILALCDQLRDQEMVDLGVALDDQEDGRALVKLVPAEQLRAARDEKAAAMKAKSDKKAASLAAAEAKRREKLEKGKVSPKELFATPEFSKWDSEGMPTHDAQGEELAKSRVKKIKKEWDAQAKLHEAYLAEMQS